MQRYFGQKNIPPSAKIERFLGEKTKKIDGSSGIRTRDMSLTVHRSTHYSIPPSLIVEVKIAYIKKLKISFFELEKKIIKNL